MSNPFDDLKADEAEADGEDTEQTDSSEAESAAPDSSASTDTASSATTQSPRSDSDSTSTQSPEVDRTSTSESETDTEPSEDSASDPADTGPAFEYSEVRQKPLYARDKTWNELEDELGITVTPELRRMGIRDEETREIHDAILKVAIENVDELPEMIAEERRRSD